jgi:hypothetical protein
MTDMTHPSSDPAEQHDQQHDRQHDQQPDQDAEPPGDGIDGPVHAEEPAEGP